MDDDLYRVALAFYERDELIPAAAALERVLASFPDHVEARFRLANVRKSQGDWAAAIAQYGEVLRRAPLHAQAMNNLGAVHEMQGDAIEAEACYRHAIQSNRGLPEPYTNLGRMLQALGRDGEAEQLYRRALSQGLDADLFGHLLDASTGAASAKAPASYVRETFDAFADQFDQHLLERLEYRVPWQLAALAGEHFGERRPDVLDLGCGTGLVGAALAGRAASLIGVDISPRMLDSARRRGGYAELHAAEIEAWLAAASPGSFDLVVAADVLIYFGDLATVFAGVARVLEADGAFAVSVETCVDADWRLRSSGRYAHSTAYLDRLAAANGLSARRRLDTVIRHGVQGELTLFVRH